MRHRLGSILLGATLVFGCSAPAPDESGFEEELGLARAMKDEFLLVDPESRMPDEKKADFLPLSYYTPDVSFRIPATLALADEPEIVGMPTSSGTIDQMEKVGALEFLLGGETRRLSAFVNASDTLFVPFRDETSGSETYGGGRYLDLEFATTGIYTIDFNRAYHPDCYFNEEFICPLPPPENRLRTPVTAGERLPTR